MLSGNRIADSDTLHNQSVARREGSPRYFASMGSEFLVNRMRVSASAITMVYNRSNPMG